MTLTMIENLRHRLDGHALATTGNSEAAFPAPLTRDERDRQTRETVRVHGTLLRAWLEDAKKHATEDNTIVPPLPIDRWVWLVPAIKGGIVGASLALHLLEIAVLFWLVLDVVRR